MKINDLTKELVKDLEVGQYILYNQEGERQNIISLRDDKNFYYMDKLVSLSEIKIRWINYTILINCFC